MQMSQQVGKGQDQENEREWIPEQSNKFFILVHQLVRSGMGYEQHNNM